MFQTIVVGIYSFPTIAKYVPFCLVPVYVSTFVQPAFFNLFKEQPVSIMNIFRYCISI